MNTILQDLIDHHVWANDTLLACCENLDPDELTLTGPGTYGTIEEAFVHVAMNEEWYLRGLHSVGVTTEMHASIAEGAVPRVLASVRPVLEKTAKAWRALARDWPRNAVGDFSNEGNTERLPISVFVTQVINHGTEHRAHIRTILLSNGLTPPEIDAWHWHDARVSVPEEA